MLNLLRRLVRHATSGDYEVEARLDPETVIIHNIPAVRKSKPVHKVPQFPCNTVRYAIGVGKEIPDCASVLWSDVTCGNCLRSRLKKQYDKRQMNKSAQKLGSFVDAQKECFDES